MRTPKTLTSILTLLAFLSSMTGQADTTATTTTPQNFNMDPSTLNTGTGGYAVPQYSPAPLSMQPAMKAMQSEMMKCQLLGAGSTTAGKFATDAVTNLLLKNKSTVGAKLGGASCESARKTSKKDIIDESTGKSTEVITSTFDPIKFSCDMECPNPKVSMPSCDDYYNPQTSSAADNDKRNGRDYSWHTESTKLFMEDKSKVGFYSSYLESKKDCASKDQVELGKQTAAYKCMTNVMDTAVGAAKQQVQAALGQNKQIYEKMNQFQQEVGDQMRQIDETLGPDPSDPNAKEGGAQFGGLLGIQKELKTQLATANDKESEFKQKIDKLKSDTDGNEQTLDANKMGQVVDCMKGSRNLGVSGGRSLMCYKATNSIPVPGGKSGGPVTDAAGNTIYSLQPCGALEFVRSQVQQAAFATSRGVQRSGKRTDLSLVNSSAFDSMVDSMMRDMGSYDAPSAQGKLVGRTTSQADIMKKYAGDLADLSAKTGINIQSQMSIVLGSCYKGGNDWKKQQQLSAKSDYNIKKTELDATKTSLNTDLNKGLRDLNSLYGESMAVMYGQHVTLNRFQCSTTDPDKMKSCFSSISTNLQNVLEGNGSSTGAMKPITGGSLVSGFAIPCKGINGCVTAFQQVRKQKKDQNAAAQKAKVAFVSDGNNQVQQTIQSFAGQLSQVQKAVTDQFSKMSSFLTTTLHVDAPERPTSIAAEPLVPSEGPNKEAGPYAPPKDMAAVLSGMTQPGGLVNTSDSGLKDILKNAQVKLDKQASDAKETGDKYGEIQKKFAGLHNECTKGDKPDKRTEKEKLAAGDNVGTDATSGINCDGIASACSGDGTDPDSNLTEMESALGDYLNSLSTYDEAKTTIASLKRYKGATGDARCEKALKACKAVVGKSVKGEKTTAPADTPTTAGKATG